jgi:protein-tyrosine sulfotransferase
LVRGLLDWTPGLFSIPVETHIFEHLGFWVDYELRRNIPRDLSFDQVLGSIRSRIERSNLKNSGFSQFGGDSLNSDQWNVDALITFLQDHGKTPFEEKNLSEFITAYFQSLYYSLFSEIPSSSIRFVEKSVENAEFAALLKLIFPDAKFIHVVRNPYATVVSLRKYNTMRGSYPYLGWIIDALENNFYYSIQNPLLLKDYLVLRYEDLLTGTEEKMHEVAQFLGIPFNEIMLKPTAMGKLWSGNSVSGESFSGVSTNPIEKWKTQIYPLEISVVNANLGHILDIYGYEKMIPHKTSLLPYKQEGVRNYFANRFYWQISIKRRKVEKS